jgi:PPOX class probable F420-dependent enzyme
MGTIPQRRMRRIAMTPEERDAFLTSQRTCRIATVGAAGLPHVSPLWFVWDGRAMWFSSLTRSRRRADIRHNPAVSVVVDAGDGYGELRGVELGGTVEVVGEEPRTGEPVPELEEPERLMAGKYHGGGELAHDRRHVWLRLVPEREVSWDFRKI